MQPYQLEYIQNAQRAREISDFRSGLDEGFDSWYRRRRESEDELKELKRKNTYLLNACLFPILDELHGAREEQLKELSEFADGLLDWKINLDPGVYVTVHDAMLSLYRVRRDRNALIRELYKLGMGLYYQNRYMNGTGAKWSAPFRFANEMAFTEAATYIRFFEELGDDETRGYVIRSLANIALTVRDHKRKIAASQRVLNIIRDAGYRAAAPTLPWDKFERATHQQMSSNRNCLSRGDLSREELVSVLDSCYEVFRPEQASDNPNIRWLWPYYDMEYQCGLASRELTLDRLRNLIQQTPPDAYDMSSMYGNIYLPLAYGGMMTMYPELLEEVKYARFLDSANKKMQRALLACPVSVFGDYLSLYVANIYSSYNETGCEVSYKDIALSLMQRFEPEEYIRGRVRGELVKCISERLLDRDEAFFDDIDFIRPLTGQQKRSALVKYARECAMLCDIGLVKMGLSNIRTRGLLDNENRIYLLHSVSGSEDLRKHESTRLYADTALGHSCRYDGANPPPGAYVRTQSPFRQTTDAVQTAVFIQSEYQGSMDKVIKKLFEGEGSRFSPMICALFSEESAARELEDVLNADPQAYYREVYDALKSASLQ